MATAPPRLTEDGAIARSKPPAKMKRTLTRSNFLKTVANVAASSPALLTALVRPKIPAALREKIMLGVTSVTDCGYCQWGHAHWAMAHGVPLEEVNQILGQQTESLKAKDPAEAAAILFAQHYAENLDQFDPKAIENLRQYYSDAQVKEILAYVRAITLGGLTGNTVDAFLGRLRGDAPSGKKAPPTDANQERARTASAAMRWFWWLPFGKVPEISPKQLDSLRKDGATPPQLVDVRTSAEWRSGHIAGAIHVPITEFGPRIAGLQLDATRPIIAICRSAHRSIPAVRLLQRHGFRNACQLQGGMLAWRQAELPVEGDASPDSPAR
jgi:AhpD family alkylhydroperoxidase